MRYYQIDEGRVYQIDWGYPRPVMIISNPSQAQSRTLVEILRKKHDLVYLRGLMNHHTVYVWDGHYMTHDDVLSELLPDVYADSDDLSTFEIKDYKMISLSQVQHHPAECTVYKPGPDPLVSRFVQNVMAAIDATPPASS